MLSETQQTSQLGVNSNRALIDGAYANNPKFFGTSTSEVVSASIAWGGNWNGDYAASVNTSYSWFRNGGTSGTSSGVFAVGDYPGDVLNTFGHRTILSGY